MTRPQLYDSPAARQRAYRARKRNATGANVTLTLRHDLGAVRFYHGDARQLDALAGGSVQMVVTSPPYWNAREYAAWPTYAAYLADMGQAWRECYRVLGDGGRIAVNVPDGYGRPSTGGYLSIGPDTQAALVDAGFTLRGRIIWDKRPAGLGTAWGSWLSPSDPSIRDCYEIIIVGHKGTARRPGPATVDRDTFLSATAAIWSIPPARKGWHPAPYPAELARRLIETYTYPGDTVLDPFAGSGTTVYTAARLGRLGLGVDLCAEYLDRAAAEAGAELARAAGG